MPRLRQVPRSEATNETVITMYDKLFGPDRDPVAQPGTATGTPGDWWTVYALVPDVLKHAARGFAFYGSPDRLLSPVLRELAQTRAGWAVGSQFVFSQHVKSCRVAGISQEQIDAIPSWSVADCFSPVERAVLAYADALALQGGRVSDGLFAELKKHLSDEEILELTYITTLYIAHAITTRALRLEFDDRDDPIVEVPAPSGDAAYDVGGAISLNEK